ncbi:MAG: hypothetical protein COV75_00390 [Candidatus Omnitrophica bacterium CG11_big_fil_rev_8_21_14_0_20_63_9]|nr:MAG: hypothetical protein COV75_00390 [Candidatus Omnitrophica bacterium CG11_big_fil_rev_8_21_14_0_20_63_9]
MALRRLSRVAAAISLAVVMAAGPAVAAESNEPPSFMRGLGKVFGGLVFEFPRTVLQASSEAPVVGTMVGIFAGVVNALQTTAAGFVEMSAAFDPWGAKRSHVSSEPR